MARKKTKHSQTPPLIEELDSRTLFSADFEGLLVTDLSGSTGDVSVTEFLSPDTSTASESNSTTATAKVHELVFLDTNTPEYEKLVEDLISNTNKSQVIQWILLDSSKDGIEQISNTLSQYQGLDTVHIISHGSDGNVQLGNSQLDTGTLLTNTDTISKWGNAFDKDGDLLFYGCNLAATEDGQSLINSIATLTGADVAASNDLTGSAALGGNWELEYATGTVESEVAFSLDAQQNWANVLAVGIDTTSTGQTTGPSITISHTTSGSDRLMLVSVSKTNPGAESVTSVTYNGTALTFLGRETTGDSQAQIEIWALTTPDTGTHDVVVTMDGANASGTVAGVMTFTGVDQTTSLGTFASASQVATSTATVNVSSAAGELVFSAVTAESGPDIALSVGAGQTEHWEIYQAGDNNTAGSTEAGAASVTASWGLPASNQWAIASVSIKPVSNTAPATNNVSASGSEDTASIAITLTGSDTEGTVDFYRLSSLPANGTLYTDASLSTPAATATDYAATAEALTLYFVPDSNWNGVTTFQFAAKDNGGLLDTTPATATITVNAANDAPALDNSGTMSLSNVLQNSTDPNGDLVSAIIASAGGNRITDVDSGSAEGIAATVVDDTNGSWEYSIDGGSSWIAFGSVTNGSAVVLTDTANDRIRFVPNTDYTGNATLTFRAWDTTDGNTSGTTGINTGTGGTTTAFSSATEIATIYVEPAEVLLLLSTEDDVGPEYSEPSSGVAGLPSWSEGEIIGVGDPNLSFGSGTTTGTSTSVSDFDTFAADSDVDITGLHFVTSDITITGAGINSGSINLLAGDVIFITKDTETLSNAASGAPAGWANNITTIVGDVYVFRAENTNDYSSGYFRLLMNTPGSAVQAITLVENSTLIGDTTVDAGDFLFSDTATEKDVYWYDTSLDSSFVLVSGGDIGISDSIIGLELVEAGATVGGVSLSTGMVLVTLDKDDASVGNNLIATSQNDIFSLDFSATTLGTGTAVANAAIFFDGDGNANFDTEDENLDALSLLLTGSGTNIPSVLGNSGPIESYTEGATATIIDATITIVDGDSANFDAGLIRVDITAGAAPGDRLAIFNQGTGGGQIGVSGNDVTYSGTIIGTFTGGLNSGDPLVINLNANADVMATQTLLRNITFWNVSDAPSTLARTVDFALTDGDGGTSNTVSQSVNVTAVADAPIAVNDHFGLNFDGIDDYISVADSASLTMTNTVTMEAWVKADPSVNGVQTIINKEGEYEVALFWDGTINWGFANTDPGWSWHNTGYVVADGEWTHIAVSYDNGTVSTYVNGSLVDIYNGSGAIGDNHPTLDELRIGGRSNNPAGQYFDGQIDEVRIWNTARTQAEIQTAMDQTLTGGEAGLAGYWTFSEGTGTSTADLTSNTNTGTLIDGGSGTAGPQWTGYGTDQNTQITITVANGILSNDIDGDGDALTITQVNGSGTNVGSLFTLPSGADLTVNATGAFTYDPNGVFDYLDTGQTATDSFTYQVNDGNGGTDTATTTITITGTADAPITNDVSASSNEDATSIVITLTGYDIDGTVDFFQLNSLPANGTLYTNAGLTTAAVTGTDYAATTEALTLYFVPDLNWNGVTTFNFIAKDNNGLFDASAATATLTVDPINDQLSAINLNQVKAYTEGDASVVLDNIVVTDVDTGETITATLTLANPGYGSLSTSGTATYTAGTGVWTINDSVANVNAALTAVAFVPTTNNDQNTAISIDIVDGGEDATVTATGTINLNVTAVNDAPINTLPAAQITDQDTPLTFTTGGGNGIQTNDVDAVSLEIKLASIKGDLTLNGTAGLSFTAGNGSNDTGMIFTGTVASINAALNGLIFTPDSGYNGAASITLASSDQGGSGAGGTLEDLDIVTITIGSSTNIFQNGVNGYTGTEDTELTEALPATDQGNNTSISIDLDNLGGISQGLIRFDSIFGNGANQIPFGSTIDSASLTLEVFDTSGSSTTIALHRVLTNWTESSTWNLLGTGIQLDNSEASVVIDSTMTTAEFTGPQTFFGLESAMQSWSDGASNLGWVIVTDSNDGWDFYSSEHAVVSERPKLTISFTQPQPPAIDLDANNDSGATGADFITTFTEDLGPVLIADTDAVLTDIDSTNLQSMTVILASTPDGVAESLSADTTGTSINASYNSGTRTLTLSNADTVANYLQVLKTIGYDNSSDAPDTSDRTITIIAVDDTAETSNTATTTVKITAVNDAPTATNLTQTIGYTEGAVSVAITDIVVSDADSSETITASLSLANPAYGSLTISGSATYTAGTGVWTITDTIANVNTALAAVTFVPTINNDLNTSITTHVEDAAGTGPADGSIALNITAVNDAPTATNMTQTIGYTEGDLSVALNDIVVSDVDTGEIITATLTLANPGYGALTTTGTATYTAGTGVWTITDTVANVNVALAAVAFVPVTNNDLNTTITTHIEDVSVTGPADGSIALNVSPVNDAPLATNLIQVIGYTEGDASVALGDIVVSDLDTSETITATLTLANPGYGVLTTSGTATYTAGTGVWTITDSVTNVNAALAAVAFVPMTDNDLDTSISTHIEDAAGTGPADGAITLNVTAVNDAPLATNLNQVIGYTEGDLSVAIADIVVSDVDTGETITATLTLADPPYGALTVSGTATYSAGTGVWTITDTVANVNTALAAVAFVPTTNNDQNTSITTHIEDGSATGPADGSITLNVTPVNDAPTATNLNQTIGYNEGDASVALTDIVVTDVDTGETITATLTLADPTYGALTISGTATYTAGTGVWSITDSITNVNVALANAAFIPTANNDQNTSITTHIEDASAAGPIDGSIALNVTATNDAPTATNLNQTISYNEGDASVALNDIIVTDIDTGETITATLTLVNPTYGALSTSGTATYTAGTGVWTITDSVANVNAALAVVSFVPTTNNDLDTSITTHIEDAAGTGPTDDSIALNVTAVNDAPTATNLTQTIAYTEGDISVALNDIVVTDVDTGETISATLTLGNPAYGALTISGSATYTAGTGVWTITDTVTNVNAALTAVAFVPATNNDLNTSITTHIEDAAGTGPADGSIALNVTPVNDAPLASNLTQTIAYTEGNLSVAIADIVVSDLDTGETITAILTLANPTYGALTVSGSATYTAGTGVWTITDSVINVNSALASVAFVPTTNNDLDTTITTHIEDASATGPVDGSITLNVTPINDAPLATNLNQTIAYTEGDLSVAIADIVVSDVDTGETITATLTLADPTYGALTTSGTASYTAGTGVWTITDTVTNVNTALAAVAFVPATNNDVNTSITTHIEDASVTGPADGSIALNVTAANDAPTATNLNQTIAYTEGDLSVAIADIAVSDLDTGETITATLTLADPGYGALTVSGSATYTAGTGIWTITDTIANVNAALANVAFLPATNNDLNTSITTHIEDASATGPVNGSIALNVTAVNDAPTATNLNQTIAYTEGDLSVAIADIVVSDLDTGETITATLTLADPGYGALTISGTATYTAGTGVWAISDTVANVNAALAAVSFVPTTSNDQNTSITTHIEDAAATGPVDGSIALNVTPVNDAPLATNLNQTIGYTEGDLSVALNDIVVSDLDTGETITATLTLADPTYGALTTSGAATYTAGTGIWTITDTVANVNAALANVAFVPATNNDVNTSITTHIEDASATGPVDGSIALNVTPVNDAPLATNLNQTIGYTEGDLSVALNDIMVSDLDTGETITATLTLVNPTYGALTTSGTASYTAGTGVWTITDTVANVNAALAAVAFVPTTNNDLNTSIATHIEDASATGPADGSIALNVTPVNDAPLATNLNQTIAYTEGDLSVAIADIVVSDLDTGETITATLTLADPGYGVLTTSGTASYTTGTGVWTITDAIANVNAALASVAFAPTTNNDLNTSITTHIEDASATGPVNGSIALNVTAVNDAPTATNLNQTIGYTEGDLSVTIADIVVSDLDTGETITATLTLADPTYGALTVSGAATYTAGTGIWTITDTVANVNAALANMAFVPTTNIDLNTSIITHIEDASATGPVDGSISLNVTPVNDAPLATNLNQTIGYTEGDLSVAIADIIVSDLDTGETITAILTLADPTYGGLTTSGTANYTAGTGIWTITDTVANVNAALAAVAFVPATNNDLNTSITTHIEDAATTGPVDGLIALNVTPVNDAPLATNLNQTIAYTEGDLSVALNDIVVSELDTGETITATLTLANPIYGALTTSGTATYTAGTGIWTITDSVANVNTALAAVAFVPATNNDLNTSITTHIEDAFATGPADGSIALNVIAVNDAPQGTDSTITINEDIPYTLTASDFGFSDPIEGHNFLAVRITTVASAGTLTLNGTVLNAGDVVSVNAIDLGFLVFTPALNANGIAYASFTFQVQDDGGNANGGVDVDPLPKTLTFNITPVNDTPIANDDNYTVDEDASLAVTAINGLLINDSDVDPDTLTVITTPVSGPANGLLTLNADGAFTYTADADFNGTDSFVYQMTDNNGAFATAQVTILVNPTNDNPIITLPAAASTNPGSPITFSSANANAITLSDIDGPGEDFQITLDVASGTMTLGNLAGLTLIEGDGDTDSKLVFTGKIDDINAALEGLTLTPASGFYGQTSLVMTTVNLNDPGIPPAEFVNAVAITVNAPPVVTNPTGPAIEPVPPVTTPDPVPDNEDTGPGVDLIIDEIIDPTGSHGDTTPDPEPEVEPEPEPEPELPVEPPVEEPVPPTIPEKIAEVIETIEAIPNEILETVLNRIDSDNGNGSLTDHTVMWRSIDTMLNDIDQAFAEEEHRNSIIAYGMKGMTFSLSAGFVAWVLRGGSLLATAMSSIPIWRGLDPLPVLAMSAKDRKKERKMKAQEQEDEDDLQAEIGRLIDGAKLDKGE